MPVEHDPGAWKAAWLEGAEARLSSLQMFFPELQPGGKAHEKEHQTGPRKHRVLTLGLLPPF